MVELVRGDRTKPPSGGLSVFTPIAEMSWPGYKQEAVASPGWLALSAAYASLRESDRDAPTLQRTPAKGAPEFRVQDASSVLSAETWQMVTTKGSPVSQVFQTSPAAFARSSGRISPGAWDGRGHFLCSGPCTKGNRAAIPAHFEDNLDDGSVLYSTEVVVRDIERGSEGEEGVFFFRALPDQPISDAWIVHTETDTNGEVLFFRDHYRLAQGLAVAFQVLEHDSAEGQLKGSVTDFFELRAAPHYSLGPLAQEPNRLAHAVAVRDVAGNLTVSELLPLHGSR
jgi:hypothetical protein